jgi:hypothetical protein
MVEPYLHSAIRLHGVVLNELIPGSLGNCKVNGDVIPGPFTLQQRCPTFLYIGAHLTDGCGGAGAVWRLQ